MLYAKTEYNLRYLLQVVGAVTIDQLILFFRDEAPPWEVKYHARALIFRGDADFDERTGTLTWHRSPPLARDTIRSRVESFWVVAYFGSKTVKDLDSLKFPLQLEMILCSAGDEDSEEPKYEVYDVAVCKTITDGTIAARALQRARIEGVPDEVVHIVIVQDAEIGKQMVERFGFDCYVILKKSHDTKNDIDIYIPEFSE